MRRLDRAFDRLASRGRRSEPDRVIERLERRLAGEPVVAVIPGGFDMRKIEAKVTGRRGLVIAAAAMVAALAIALPLLFLLGGEEPVVTTEAPTTTAPTTTIVPTTAAAFSTGIVVVAPDACEGCDELAATLTDLARGEVAIQVVAAPAGDQRPAVQVVAADGSVVAEWKGTEATTRPADRAIVDNAGAMILAACELLGGCSPDTTSTTATTMVTLPPPTVDGTIAFARVMDVGTGDVSNTDIFVIRSDGTGLTQLTSEAGREAHPSWSPDGSRIAYDAGPVSGLYDTHASVWVMNADGSGKVQLTDANGSLWPVWSPDGAQIAYVRVFRSDPRATEIFVMNADGSGQRCVIQLEGDDGFPEWTPDGRIMFVNAGGLHVVNPDGTGLVTLGIDPDALVRPVQSGLTATLLFDFALSPDGTTIAYLDQRTHQVLAIPFGGDGTPLTLLESAAWQYLATSDSNIAYWWTPDGQALALASDSGMGQFGSTILIVNADGTGLSMVPGIDTAMDPAWRPEG